MKLKRAFILNGEPWQIFVASQRELRRLYKPSTVKAGDDLCGLCCPDTRSIFIYSRMSQAAKSSFMLHELIEAMNTTLKIGLTHGQIYKLQDGFSQIVRLPEEADL